MSVRILLFVLAGFGLLGVVALKRPLRRFPLSIPMLYVGLGALAFWLPLGLPVLDPVGEGMHAAAAEYLTEFIVIISLAAAGLAIDRRFSLGGWSGVWPLLGITMPLSIVALGLVGWSWLGLTPAAALLLAAALSPTDPVLAESVHVGPPNTADERDDVRFGLTVEAGINDGLAFPFTYLAIAAVGQASLGAWTLQWAAFDLVYRVVVGVLVGVLIGYVLSGYIFRMSNETGEDGHSEDDEGGQTNEGLIVMATIFLAYGIAEIAEGYGFLAVFACLVAARQNRKRSDYHERTHQFTQQLEKVVLVGMLFGFGGLLASGILAPLTWPAALAALAFVFVIRPLTGVLATLRGTLPWPGRLAVAFFGIRGMGTIYYLAYAQNHAASGTRPFEGLDLVWATASFAILVSIVVHGVTAGPVLRWLDRHDANKEQDGESWEEMHAAES